MPISSFIKKMMMAQQLKLEEGRTELLGFRMAFLPTHTLGAIIEDLYNRVGEDAFDLLFDVGRNHGDYAIEVLGREHDIPRKQFLEQTMDSASVMGLGVIKIEQLDLSQGKGVFTIHDSPFVEECQNSSTFDNLDRPVDELIRGMAHSIMTNILDEEVISEETHCVFQGDSHCRIVVTTKTQ